MRITSRACLLLGTVVFLCWNPDDVCVHAFVQPQLSTTRTLKATSTSVLHASLPPPPPPPPSLLQESFPLPSLDELTRTLTANLNGLESTLQGTLSKTQVNFQPLESLASLKSIVSNLKDTLQQLDAQTLQQLHSLSDQLATNQFLTSSNVPPQLESVMQFLSQQGNALLSNADSLTGTVSPTVVLLLVASSVVATALSWAKSAVADPPPSRPYPDLTYDPVAAGQYFGTKPIAVLQRGLDIALNSLLFASSLLSDKLLADPEEQKARDEQRGRELAVLLTKLGPTFIKIGQSLSIRTDLLSPGYILGLQTLQDQVPPFDNAAAQRILEEQWNAPLSDIIVETNLGDPVAAASLGQVYKATLKSTGQTVAIKVQRPNIMEQISLDMHLLRESGGLIKTLFNPNTDTVGTVDVWGAGFVDELDYLAEANNAELFQEQIATTPLKEVVFAPKTVRDYTTRNVLVTEWVDGERLDKSSSEDVTVLCSVAMNTYLTMLLELGILHCDPHPGNLLRTPEGKLCVLDWGMVSSLDKDLQLTMIEHVAHLTSRDYKEVPRDLLLLGFVPKDRADAIDDSGVVEVLAGIYGALTDGGGAAAVDVNQVVAEMQDLTAKKGNIFQIPPYFAYIAKSFSVLEGIGLSNDPNYSIINECLPYISKRLLTDNEKMGPALNTFIFGAEKTNQDRIVDYKRVKQLVEGFGEYTTSASGAMLDKKNLTRTELLDEAADQILDLVFSEEETPLQGILIEQMAKVVSSGSRSVFTELRERSGVLPSGRTRLGTLVDPLGLWRTSPLVRPNELDEKTVDTTRRLFGLFQEQAQKSDNPLFDLSTLSREEAITLTTLLSRKVWERRRGVVQTSNRFARSLLELTASKLEIGERDTRTIAPRLEQAAVTKEEAVVVTAAEQPATKAIAAAGPTSSSTTIPNSSSLTTSITATKSPNHGESSRLAGARKLLDDLNKEAADTTAPAKVTEKTS